VLLTTLVVACFAAAMVCGFLAIVAFIRAGFWPAPGRPAAARLELLLGLDLPEPAHRHWRRAWSLTVAFLTLWAVAIVTMALVVPLLR
jgi:hypothetical protein